MSKLETVRALDDTAPQLQIVRSIRDLQQTVTQMQQDLKALPDAIATETTQSLEPLNRLQRDVTRALESFDQITATQRQALTEMAEQIAQDAAREMNKKISAMDTTLSSLNPAAQQITTAANNLNTAQQRMTETAAASAMPLWLIALLTTAAGAVGALVVLIGQSVLGG